MSRPVEWLSGANTDLLTAFDRFEDQQEDAGKRFLAMVESCLQQVRQFPEMSPVYLGRIRRKLVERSVYGIFYAVEPTRIIVVALMDLRQDPRQIRRRLLS